MTNLSMKREYSEIGQKSESASKRIHFNPYSTCNFENISLPSINHGKRCFDDSNICDSKRQHYYTNDEQFTTSLPNDVVRKLAISPQCLSNNNQLPSCIIKDLEDQAYKLSSDYKNQAIVLYRKPNEDDEEEEIVEENEEDDLGPVSYYYPVLHDNLMEPASPISNESEDLSLSPQEQMRRTGMLGVPPLPEDDHSWIN